MDETENDIISRLEVLVGKLKDASAKFKTRSTESEEIAQYFLRTHDALLSTFEASATLGGKCGKEMLRLQKLQVAYQQIRCKIEVLEGSIASYKSEIDHLVNVLEKETEEKAVVDGDKANVDEEIASLESSIVEMEEKISKTEQQRDNLQNKLDELTAEKETQYKEKVKAIRELGDLKRKRDELRKIKKSQSNLLTQLQSYMRLLEGDISHLTNAITINKTASSSLEEEIEAEKNITTMEQEEVEIQKKGVEKYANAVNILSEALLAAKSEITEE